MRVCSECSTPTKTIGRAEVCVACFVRRTTEAQGLPERVEDPVVLAQVAALLGATR